MSNLTDDEAIEQHLREEFERMLQEHLIEEFEEEQRARFVDHFENHTLPTRHAADSG